MEHDADAMNANAHVLMTITGRGTAAGKAAKTPSGRNASWWCLT